MVLFWKCIDFVLSLINPVLKSYYLLSNRFLMSINKDLYLPVLICIVYPLYTVFNGGATAMTIPEKMHRKRFIRINNKNT